MLVRGVFAGKDRAMSARQHSLAGTAQGSEIDSAKYFQTRTIIFLISFKIRLKLCNFPEIDCAFAPFGPPLRCP